MAYIDDDHAVLSLGCSCQTNHQINAQIEAIQAVLNGTNSQQIGTYFDWLIAPSASVERLIDGRLPIPATPDDILWHRGKPEYAGYGSLFYHEFLNNAHVNEYSDSGLATLRAKFSHTTANFLRCVQDRRTTFVWSNTQNNLDHVARECDGLDLMLDNVVIDRIVASGDKVAGPAARYIFVTYERRVEPNLRYDPARVTVHVLPPDNSVWEGCQDDWRQVFMSLNH